MAQSQHSTSLHDTSTLTFDTPPRLVIVHTEWNDTIVRELKNGCESMVHKFGGEILDIITVPGSFELPFGCKMLWNHYDKQEVKPEVIIALGAVIRGGTPHFEYVSKAVTDGIVQLNLTLPIPVIFGVLTLDTIEQAWERLGGSMGHKGEEAGLTALKMIALHRRKP